MYWRQDFVDIFENLWDLIFLIHINVFSSSFSYKYEYSLGSSFREYCNLDPTCLPSTFCKRRDIYSCTNPWQIKIKNQTTKPIIICSAPTLSIFKKISFLQGSLDMARVLLLIQKCLKGDIEKFTIFLTFFNFGFVPRQLFLIPSCPDRLASNLIIIIKL